MTLFLAEFKVGSIGVVAKIWFVHAICWVDEMLAGSPFVQHGAYGVFGMTLLKSTAYIHIVTP